MINHARTLLMNVKGADFPGEFMPYPGEELIPAFRPLELPGYLDQVRQYLFGSSPDRYMLNYRVGQLLEITHATPLEEYLLALDPRITYGRWGYEVWADSIFTPKALRISGTQNDTLTVVGRPDAPDVHGKCYHLFEVDVLTPETVSVSLLSPTISNTVFNLVLESGLSNQIPLNGTGYSFRLATDNPGQKWRVTIVNRPQFDVSRLVESLTKMGEPTLNSLFGITQEEPYYTFKNLWTRKHELPLKLAALVCALVYRTEERRLAGA